MPNSARHASEVQSKATVPASVSTGTLAPRASGDSGVGALMGPGQHNWDISLIKNTKLTERLNTQFRAEFYNVWNHPQFNPPVNNIADTTFGQIQNSSVPPRIMQFAVKFLF